MTYNCPGGYSSSVPASTGGYSQCSPLEAAVEYAPSIRMSEEAPQPQHQHLETAGIGSYKNAKQYSEGLYLSKRNSQNYYFKADAFLNDIPTEFISCGDDQQKEFVRSLVEDAFEATAGKQFPKDIAVRICSEKELRKFHESHGGKWYPGIKGFSINRRGFGTSEVFAKEDELARLMLTLGHEIGHVITLPMKESVDEEAKAFAFSMAWMKAIKDKNIGSLSQVINPMPAKNGLHNIAFEFVIELMEKGRKAIDVYLDLIKGEVSIDNQVPVY
jgi:hypothetical protein